MAERIFHRLHVAPAPWPNAKLDPSDVTQFVPNGLGLGAPMMLRPWDKLEDLERQGGYYGYDRPTGHPLRDAPTNVAAGGVVYFDDQPAQANLALLANMLGIRQHTKEYAAIWSQSENPQHDRYIDQLRIVSKIALAGVFAAPLEPGMESLVDQPLSIGEALWAFIEDQQDYWGEGMNAKLDGIMGGDGDWARESLCFGLMVENSYRGIYRIWSRAWLVTK